MKSSSSDWNTNAPALRGFPSPASLTRTGLYPALSYVLEEVRKEVGYKRLFEERTYDSTELITLIGKIADRAGFKLSSFEQDEVLAHLERDAKPFGLLQDLVEDPRVTDIIITNASKVSVQRGRDNFSTHINFPNQGFYEAFVEKLLARAGTTYSTKQPFADGMIGEDARIHAVHKTLCESGPYVTIRINRYRSVAVQDLFESGLAPLPILQYLTALVRAGQTLLIAGEVGTGKTTLARALAGTIPPEESILVIEDTPEIRLSHPHVRYIATREENIEGAGRIAPSLCIRAGMRMAMNRIVFGEIRDAEAAEAFVDVCTSGHPGMSTIHARSAMEAVARMELFLGRAQPGVGRSVLSEQLANSVQALVHLNVCGATGRRRIVEVREIGPVADGVVRQRLMFTYQWTGTPRWKVHNKVSAHRDRIEGDVKLSALSNELILAE